MVAKTVAVGLLCAVFVLGSHAQLIEINGNSAPSSDDGFEDGGISIVGPVNPDQPGASIDQQNSQLFGEADNSDDGGINIVGPVNPGTPGASIDTPNQTQVPGNKVTEDPWQAFYDPNNKNIFGQTFPKPEDDNSNFPNTKLQTVDPQQPTPYPPTGSNNGGLQEVPNNHYEFPGVETTAAPTTLTTQSLITSAPTTLPPTLPPTTQAPTTTTKKHGGIMGIGEGLGGIFGWAKHTTQKPQTGDKKGHGGIFGTWKDALESNKDVVHKAAESVKEAGEKVAQAGKDVIEAGLKIKGSLIPNFLGGKSKN